MIYLIKFAEFITSKIHSMEKRIDALENTVTEIKVKLESFGELVTAGFKKVDINFESIGTEIKGMNSRLMDVDSKIEHMDSKIDCLDKKVDLLKCDTTEGFKAVNAKIEMLTDQVVKIGKVTNYVEYYNNLKVINSDKPQ